MAAPKQHSPASFLNLRERAEESAADLPGLMAIAQKTVQSILSGDHPQRKPGAGEKFWQFRDYDLADRPQDIDWRQSAKGDHVYVRQREHQNTQHVVLWCANGPNMNFKSRAEFLSKADAARIISMALAILSARTHEKVSLLGADFRPGRTEKTLQLLGENLIGETQRELKDIHFVSFPKNANLMMVGDFLDPEEEIHSAFDALAGQTGSGTVIQVLDPAELNLPWEGRVVFEDALSPQKEIIDNVSSIRERYAARIERHLDFVRGLCRENGWHYALHRTDEDIRQTLLAIWMTMTPDKTGGAH